jgi:hypothetical protein
MSFVGWVKPTELTAISTSIDMMTRRSDRHAVRRVADGSEAIEANRRDVIADENYIQRAAPIGVYPQGYYLRNTFSLPRRRVPLCHNAAIACFFGAIRGNTPITSLTRQSLHCSAGKSSNNAAKSQLKSMLSSRSSRASVASMNSHSAAPLRRRSSTARVSGSIKRYSRSSAMRR